jgi:hypothetical protein
MRGSLSPAPASISSNIALRTNIDIELAGLLLAATRSKRVPLALRASLAQFLLVARLGPSGASRPTDITDLKHLDAGEHEQLIRVQMETLEYEMPGTFAEIVRRLAAILEGRMIRGSFLLRRHRLSNASPPKTGRRNWSMPQSRSRRQRRVRVHPAPQNGRTVKPAPLPPKAPQEAPPAIIGKHLRLNPSPERWNRFDGTLG